jgi:hypothetical protein
MAAFISRALGLEEIDRDYFDDDEGHLFSTEIDRLATAGITLGCNPPSNDAFCPDRPMSRGAMAAMLVRAFDYPKVVEDFFEDDGKSIFEDEINRLAAAGVTVGCDPPRNKRFCPGEPVTRGQMATFLTRALGLEMMKPPPRVDPVVAIASRESWGARTADVSRLTHHTVTRLTVHHAGTQAGTNGPPQFRGWQNFHIDDRGWPDIAYHLLIGMDGTVYEARDPAFRGDTGTTYDTTGHFLVVVEGNFNDERPTDAQIESLTAVLAGASAQFGVSPSTISGHRDHAATSCPGTNLASIIDSGELRRSVEALIVSGGARLVWP